MKIVDFGFSWSDTVEEDFIRLIQQNCREKGLSVLWISDKNVKEIVKALESSRLMIKVLLDVEATYDKKDDLYAKVCYYVKDAGGVVINDPDRTKHSIDKSITHYELMHAGIKVPYTVVVRNWQPSTFRLTDDERQRLKAPFIIKPALGYGQLGVIRDAKGSIREIARARNFSHGDNFLLQEKIHPTNLNGKRAWFRVFNVFDTIIPCWWDDQLNLYEHIKYEEFNNFRLYPLAKITAKIASITRMVWFSTEIAVEMRKNQMCFLAIDYVNDQCDMSTKRETSSGVPEAVVEFTASSIVNAASEIISGYKLKKKYTIYLADAKIELRGLGISQDLLKHNKAVGVKR